jgi:uncharacterized membrane protein YeaQ/YmgE (transglycosylase-associated protein family)
VAIVSWILLGTVVGLMAHRLLPGSFPGGVLGTVAAATAGAFLGGAGFTLVASREVSGFDGVSLLVAFLCAALLLTVARKAEYAGQHPPLKR